MAILGYKVAILGYYLAILRDNIHTYTYMYRKRVALGNNAF